MQTDTEWWRAHIVRLVTEVADCTTAEYDRERWAALDAQQARDDATLMRFRRKYDPDNSAMFAYPGPDHRTTTLP